MKFTMLINSIIMWLSCLISENSMIDKEYHFDYELTYIASSFDNYTNKTIKNDTMYYLISGSKNRFAITNKDRTYFEIRDFDKRMFLELKADRDTNFYYSFPDISLNFNGFVRHSKTVKIEGRSCNKITFSPNNEFIMQEIYISNVAKLKIASHLFIGTGGKIIVKFFGLPVLMNEYSVVNKCLFRVVKLQNVRQVNDRILLSNYGKVIEWE